MMRKMLSILFLNMLFFTNVFAEKVCVEYKESKSVLSYFQEKKCLKKVDKKYADCESWSTPFWGEEKCTDFKERTVCMSYIKVNGKSVCKKEIPQEKYEKLPLAEALPTFEDNPDRKKKLEKYLDKNTKLTSEFIGDHESLEEKISSEMDSGVIETQNAIPVCCSGGICRFSDEALSCDLTEGTVFDSTGEQNSDLGDVLSIISMQSQTGMDSSFKGFSDASKCESCYRRVFNSQKKLDYDDVKKELIKKVKRDMAKDHLNKLLLNAGILRNYYTHHKDKFDEVEKDEEDENQAINLSSSNYGSKLNDIYGKALKLPSGPSSPIITSLSGKKNKNLFQCLPFERLESEAGNISENCTKDLDNFLKDYGRHSNFSKKYYNLHLEGASRNLATGNSIGSLYNKNLNDALKKRVDDVRSQISSADSELELDRFYLSIPLVLTRHNQELRNKCKQIKKSERRKDLFHYSSKSFSLYLIALSEGRDVLDGSESLKMEKLMLVDPNLGIHFNDAKIYCDVLDESGNDLEPISKVDFKSKIQKSGLLSFDKRNQVLAEASSLVDSLCIQQADKILRTLCYEDDENVIGKSLKDIKPEKMKLNQSEKIILAEESCKARVIEKKQKRERSFSPVSEVVNQDEVDLDRMESEMRDFDNKSNSFEGLGSSGGRGFRESTINHDEDIANEIQKTLDQGQGRKIKARNEFDASRVREVNPNASEKRVEVSASTLVPVSEPAKVEEVSEADSANVDFDDVDSSVSDSEFSKMYSDMIDSSNNLLNQKNLSNGRSVQDMINSGEIKKPNASDLQDAIASDEELGKQFVDVSGSLADKLKNGVDAVDELEDYLVNDGDSLENSLKDGLEKTEKEKLLKEIEDLKAAAVVSALEKKHNEKVKVMESRIKNLESELAGFKKVQAAGVNSNNRKVESNRERTPSNFGVNGSTISGATAAISKKTSGGGSDYNAGSNLSPALKGMSPQERAKYLNQIKKIPKSVIENPEQFNISLMYDKDQSRALLVVPKAGLTTDGEYALYPDQIRVDSIENPTVVMLGDIKRAIPISNLSKESRDTVISLVKLQTEKKKIQKQDFVKQKIVLAKELLETEKKLASRYSTFKACLKDPQNKVCK